MKKLFYYLLFPSVLFSQTTPSVTPRADGEGSLGTETYRWGEGHFDELYVEAPSLADDSNRVPTTSWVNNLIKSDVDLVSYTYKASSFTAEPNKKYVVDTTQSDITVTLPILSGELIASSIIFRHSAGTNNIIINRAGSNIIVDGESNLTSFTFKGLGSEIELTSYTTYAWVIIRSNRTIEPSLDSDTNVAATTAWVNDLVEGNVSNITTLLSGYLKKNSYPTGYQTHEGELIIESEANSEPLQFDFQGGLADSAFGFKWDADGNIMRMGVTYDTDPFVSLLEFSSLDNPVYSPTYIESNVPLFVPDQGAVEYDDDRVATTEWVNWAISEAGGGTTEDPVFTGIVTAPTIFSSPYTDTIRIISPAGGAITGDATVAGAYIRIEFPEVPVGNTYRCYLTINVEAKARINVVGNIVSNTLQGVYVSGTTIDSGYLTIETGYCDTTSGYFKPSINIKNIRDLQTCVVIEEVIFYTEDDIVDYLKDPFTTYITNSDPAGSGVFATNYIYPPATAISNNKLTGGIIEEATPASASATGTKGMIRYDSTYVYICIATDTWIRFEKANW